MSVYGSMYGSIWCLYTCDSSGVSNHFVEASQGGINSPNLQTSRWEKTVDFLRSHQTVRCTPPDRPVRAISPRLSRPLALENPTVESIGPSGACNFLSVFTGCVLYPERPMCAPDRLVCSNMQTRSLNFPLFRTFGAQNRTVRCVKNGTGS